MAEEHHPEDSEQLMTVLKFLGTIQMLQDELEAATQTFTRTVALSEEALGKENPETARHIGNLAAVVLQTGNQAEGKAQLRHAIYIWEQQPELDPVCTVSAMTNLAEV
jgi:hypothetical protein